MKNYTEKQCKREALAMSRILATVKFIIKLALGELLLKAKEHAKFLIPGYDVSAGSVRTGHVPLRIFSSGYV